MRKVLWLAGCLALLYGNFSTEAAEKFERKYTENSRQTVQSETKVEQTLKIVGMALETKATTLVVANTAVGERDAEGKLASVETVTSLQGNFELPGGLNLQFDSGNPDKKADNPALEPLLDAMRVLLKHPVTITVDRENKVTEVKIEGNPKDQLPKEVQSSVDPEVQKRRRESAWAFLPDKEVDAAAEWERFVDKDLGGGQSMNFKMKYTYAGKATHDGKTYDKFTPAHLEVTYFMDPNFNPMIQVSKSEMKIEKSSGTILYDPATGAIPLRESEVKITGTLTLVINGQELPSELDLTLKEKATVQK